MIFSVPIHLGSNFLFLLGSKCFLLFKFEWSDDEFYSLLFLSTILIMWSLENQESGIMLTIAFFKEEFLNCWFESNSSSYKITCR